MVKSRPSFKFQIKNSQEATLFAQSLAAYEKTNPCTRAEGRLGVTLKRGLGFRLNACILTLVYTDLYQV